MTETPLWLIWPANPAASLLLWAAVAILWAAVARGAMLRFARTLQQWGDDLMQAGGALLAGRMETIREQSRAREQRAALQRLEKRAARRSERLDWLSEEEGARLRAAAASLDSVVQQAEDTLTPNRSAGSPPAGNRPERSDITTALLGWRRVVRLQGDIGRSLQRLERAQATVSSDANALAAAESSPDSPSGGPGGSMSLIPDVIQWLLFVGVIAANGWLLFPGIESLGVPGTALNTVVFLALVLAQIITALACWQATGRLMTALSVLLMVAWSLVLGLLANLSLPGEPTTGAAVVRVSLGALVPLWILLAVRWLPDLLSVVTRLLELVIIAVLAVLQLSLTLLHAAIALLCQVWILLTELLAAPVTGPLQLFRQPQNGQRPDDNP